jgi:hypothetical protein
MLTLGLGSDEKISPENLDLAFACTWPSWAK